MQILIPEVKVGLPGDAEWLVLMLLAWLLRTFREKQERNKGIFMLIGKQNPCCGLKAKSCRGPETFLETFTGLAQGSEQ